MSKSVCIIGAGNIGSRHLQALAKITESLIIYVVDPSTNSLNLAKSRYEEIQTSNTRHQVNYSQDIDSINSPIDTAIIATNSNIRYSVTKRLLDHVAVKYLILEKVLFDKLEQYEQMEKLLSRKKCRAWVNCSRRTMPFYRNLKTFFKDQKNQYLVSGSQWGLASNAIHYIDYMVFLTNCPNFNIDTSLLDVKPIESKRKGFLELTGSLNIYFENGSLGTITSYPTGTAPLIMQIFSEKNRVLTMETEGKSYISKSVSNWNWKIEKTPMLYQSEMTNTVVSKLLNTGDCDLTPYNQSAKLHIILLESLLKFLNKHSAVKYSSYPFT